MTVTVEWADGDGDGDGVGDDAMTQWHDDTMTAEWLRQMGFAPNFDVGVGVDVDFDMSMLKSIQI